MSTSRLLKPLGITAFGAVALGVAMMVADSVFELDGAFLCAGATLLVGAAWMCGMVGRCAARPSSISNQIVCAPERTDSESEREGEGVEATLVVGQESGSGGSSGGLVPNELSVVSSLNASAVATFQLSV
jgi:hypothetical protein